MQKNFNYEIDGLVIPSSPIDELFFHIPLCTPISMYAQKMEMIHILVQEKQISSKLAWKYIDQIWNECLINNPLRDSIQQWHCLCADVYSTIDREIQNLFLDSSEMENETMFPDKTLDELCDLHVHKIWVYGFEFPRMYEPTDFEEQINQGEFEMNESEIQEWYLLINK